MALHGVFRKHIYVSGCPGLEDAFSGFEVSG